MKVLTSHFERRLSRATVTDVVGALAGIRSAAAQPITSFTDAAIRMTVSTTSFSSAMSATASSMTAFGSLSSSLNASCSNLWKRLASADENSLDGSDVAKG